MNSLLYYLIQVIICSGILYGYYHFALRNKKFHLYNRYYLLTAAGLSILIPFLNISVYFIASAEKPSVVLQTLAIISPHLVGGQTTEHFAPVSHTSIFTLKNISEAFYLIVAFFVFIRFLTAIFHIKKLIHKYIIERINHIYFINTEEPGTPFSFFKWLFWNKKIALESEEGQQIFRHELFHIKQKHSWDVIFIEIISIIFWVNPFFYFIKKEIKIIHEFLADEFSTKEKDKWNYAELLLTQVLNTHSHGLLNLFFHNQVKRRVAMITSSQKTGYQYLRKIMVLPVAIIVLSLFSFSYKNKKENSFLAATDKPIKVIIDAGHGMNAAGKHEGVRALDGSYEDDIVLSIAKKIKELNTNDKLQIILTREDRNSVDLEKRIEFSNSQNPDLLISLHTNIASKEENDDNGMDIYVSRRNTKYYSENKILATILFNYISQIHSVNKIKQREAGIYVIDKSNCPSALVECGYMSNDQDLAFMKDADDQEKIAKSILQSIEQYFLQKGMPDWEERKKTVSDTAMPVIKFNRNAATGKMEGSIEGKKIKEINVYIPTGQFVFILDGEIMMISEEETKILKKQYGKSIEELITKQIGKDVKGDDNKIFEKVEVEASFPGGETAWDNFIENNLKESIPVDKNASGGTYTIWLQFIVDKEGNISNIKPLTNFGYGMEEEAVRVMQLSPKWIPATQNGYTVKAYRKQPVNFHVKKTKTEVSTIDDNGNYRNDNYPSGNDQRQKAISEVKALARNEGKAAYIYKGRTYVFARINDPDPNIASFTELDGTDHAFLLNGKLVRSVDEINRSYSREDVKALGLISPGEALSRFNINDAIVSIETFDKQFVTKRK